MAFIFSFAVCLPSARRNAVSSISFVARDRSFTLVSILCAILFQEVTAPGANRVHSQLYRIRTTGTERLYLETKVGSDFDSFYLSKTIRFVSDN